MSEALDIETLREQFVGRVFDEQVLEFTAQEMVDFASACGEQSPRYTDSGDPDFQASPTFPCCFRPTRRFPDGFPALPGLGMDAGKAVEPHQPIRPGVALTIRAHLHDVYAKTGRSGRMTFLVTRLDVYDPGDVLLASADSRIVIRERPQS